jgi:hypothetical protein
MVLLDTFFTTLADKPHSVHSVHFIIRPCLNCIASLSILLYGLDDWEYDYVVAVPMTCHLGPHARGLVAYRVIEYSTLKPIAMTLYDSCAPTTVCAYT